MKWQARYIHISVFVMIAAIGCGRGGTVSSQKSPDGTMTLITSVNHSSGDGTRNLCVAVDIADSGGKTLHHEVTPASHVHRWSIQWTSNDEILLKSSDVGDYHIRRQPDGTWKGEFTTNLSSAATN